ncbi:M61 family metallopeptidase [Sphingobium nicotianae]|uniref:Peptidase M61 n=1 Tax=Sphingobium nicotianae TaxID=2782607 RepID=A0A9X1IT19_9SPHN|nr:peptidase M61 [Sphingobium nicotianae]MBT2188804.1 peptidase M61 [Sphingobium nicotianae]
MRRAFQSVLLALAFSPLPAVAQDAPPTPIHSAPVAAPLLRTVPEPRDIAWAGGTMKLEVDATDTARRIINVKQTIPVSTSGPLTLLFPEWIPGNHAPRGQLEKLASLVITANGKPIEWQRDALNVYAFHISVPAGAASIVATFQFLAPTKSDQGRVNFTDSLINLQWFSVSLYPAGFYTRRIPVQANVTLPPNWTAATALRGTRTGNTISYDATDYETLIDSPLLAGRFSRTIDLGHDVALNVFADDPEQLLATPEQVALHKKLADEMISAFGARHFDHYDYLFSISETLGGIGVEHHRSSENGVGEGYFTKWADSLGDRDLLAHEFTHSWNGKYRSPAGLWTPDFSTPMQDDLLWVYEGQTQFWGYVLATRAGLLSKAEGLDAFAAIAARLDATRGREWRPVADTTRDPIISARRPKGWPSWERSEDYYNEGAMIWLEADAIIAKGTNGAKGLDDFAKAFFGVNDGDWGTLTYERQDVIDTLNSVYPYDWATFLRDRIDRTNKEVTKGGFTLGGYKLVYGETPNLEVAAYEKSAKTVDQRYGVGLVVGNDGDVKQVIWNSPAFRAGMIVGNKIVAINGTEYSGDGFRAAIKATSDKKAPLSFILKQDKQYRTITLDYSGGLRYPRLEKTGEGQTSLDRLLEARTGAAPTG